MLLTGASSGIGKATALELARQGAELTIVCRTEPKAKQAQKQISAASGNSAVEALAADLSILDEVRKLAQEFSDTHSQLNVLINNAGSAFPEYAETADGLERTMAVNYFAPFLLTNLLLPLLERGAPSRVVNVSSSEHAHGHLELSNLNGRGEDMGVAGSAAYARSKLAVTLFTFELARRTKGHGITSNCLHPGAVRTGIWRHAGRLTPLMVFFSLFMISPKRGARTSIYLATSPEVMGTTGKYFLRSKIVPSSQESQDLEMSRKLWEQSLEIVGLPARSKN